MPNTEILYELIYSSRVTVNVNLNMLEEILEVSQKNNNTNNITGLLIFDGEMFCQILEGDKDLVLSAYENIMQDNRHTECTLFHVGEIKERSFPNWSMSYKWCQEQTQLQSWMEWLSAQKVISELSSENSFGCRILKLINGTADLNSDNSLNTH